MINLLDITEQLKKAESNPYCTEKDIRQVLNELKGKKRLIMPIIDFHPNKKIICRVRAVESFDEVKSVADISYLPVDKCTRYGRAHIPGHPVFYGTVATYCENLDEMVQQEIALSLLEGCKCFRDTPYNDGEYKAAMGFWKNKELLSLSSFVNPETDRNRAAINKSIAREYPGKGLIPHVNCTDEELKRFLSYLHEKFISPVYNEPTGYFVSAMFAHDVLFSNLNPIDGICYESAQGRADAKLENCLSVALKPDAVDNKLSFLGIHYYTISLIKGEAQVKRADYNP